MPEYDNTNRGVLFKGKKEKETHPDYEGTINVDGKEFWLNAWLQTSKTGTKFMSLSIKPKMVVQTKRPTPRDDDTPF
jgi:hypothetical protein